MNPDCLRIGPTARASASVEIMFMSASGSEMRRSPLATKSFGVQADVSAPKASLRSEAHLS
jgi:hypothetical protein